MVASAQHYVRGTGRPDPAGDTGLHTGIAPSASCPALQDEPSRNLQAPQGAGAPGLIARGREAQWRPCRLKGAPLKGVADWVEHYRRFWGESFDRLDDYLRELQKKEKRDGRKK